MIWMIKKDSKSVILANHNGKLRKFICTCGYSGAANVKNKRCPICIKTAEIELIRRTKEYVTELSKEENENKIIFTYTIYTYKVKDQTNRMEDLHFSFFKKMYKLELDKITGDCTLSKGKTKNVIPLEANKQARIQLFCAFEEETKYDTENQRIIIDNFFKARGIYDLEVDDLIKGQFYRLFLFIKYPILQVFNTSWVEEPLNQNHIKAIQKAKGKEELMKGLIGHKSSKILKMIKEPDVFNFLLVWGKRIKRTENLINFLDKINIESMFPRYFNQENSLKTELNTGLDLIISLHQNLDEKVWIYRLLKASTNEHGEVGTYALERFVEDIGRMYNQIKELNSEYEVIFRDDLTELHDQLVKEYRKMTIQNHVISYDESEKKLEKKINEKRNIVLAPDTYYLLDVGNKMHICVGSYGKMAQKKECKILVLEEEKNPVVCLEIRGNDLVQAKMKRNSNPEGEYLDEVIRWCKDNKITYENCHDIA
jgi:hypothetical protein